MSLAACTASSPSLMPGIDHTLCRRGGQGHLHSTQIRVRRTCCSGRTTGGRNGGAAAATATATIDGEWSTTRRGPAAASVARPAAGGRPFRCVRVIASGRRTSASLWYSSSGWCVIPASKSIISKQRWCWVRRRCPCHPGGHLQRRRDGCSRWRSWWRRISGTAHAGIAAWPWRGWTTTRRRRQWQQTDVIARPGGRCESHASLAAPSTRRPRLVVLPRQRQRGSVAAPPRRPWHAQAGRAGQARRPWRPAPPHVDADSGWRWRGQRWRGLRAGPLLMGSHDPW